MIPRIKYVQPLPNLNLHIVFDDGKSVIYNMTDDIQKIPQYRVLITQKGLFENFEIDDSRTCLTWSEEADLPSDIISEYGKEVAVYPREINPQNSEVIRYE